MNIALAVLAGALVGASAGAEPLSDWGRAALRIEPGRWRRMETAHFVIYHFRDGEKIARRSEQFYGEMREFFGNRPDLFPGRKSLIFAFREAADWERFTDTIGLGGIVGVTRGHEFFYLSTGEDGRFDAQAKVQAHEMAHLIFNRLFRTPPPLWLNEGIAEYFGQRKTTGLVEFRRLMGQKLPFDLDTLFTATEYPRQPAARSAFYVEAAIVVDFLTRTAERRALLPRFVDVMIESGDLKQAAAVYGYRDVEEFKEAYRRYRRRFQ